MTKEIYEPIHKSDMSSVLDLADEQMKFAKYQYHSLIEALKAGEMENIFETSWKGIIDQAILSGWSEAVIPIAENTGNNSNLTTVQQAIIDYGIEFLSNNGFKAVKDELFCSATDTGSMCGDSTLIRLSVSLVA